MADMVETSSAKIRCLLSSLRNTTPTGQHFFIYDDLKTNVTKELVFDALSSSIPLHRRAETVEVVIKKGLRLFCSLVWIHQQDHITQFLEHNTLDERMPVITETEVNRTAPNLTSQFYTETQWEFFPWHFDKGLPHMSFSDNLVLPFTEETDLTEGAGGEISIVSLPATLQSFVDSKVRANITLTHFGLRTNGSI